MSANVRAMVMAAGAGTRLRPLTLAIPKPMVPVANRPVLEYTLENLRRHGITEIVLNLHSHPEMMRRHFGDGSRWGIHLTYSHEPKLLGTAGGVKKVGTFLKAGPFLVMSGDGLTTVDLTKLLDFHERKKSFGTMGVKGVDSRFDYGVTVLAAGGRIKRFIEKPLWSDVFSNQVNTGVYLFEPQALSQIPAGKVYDFGHELWPKLLKAGKPIFGYPLTEYWCDIGNLNEYRRAHHDMLDGQVGLPLLGRQLRPGVWVGAGTVIEKNVRFHAPCLIGKGSRISRGAEIGVHSVIGDNCKVGANSILRETILWNNVNVGPRALLEKCILGHGVRFPQKFSAFEAVIV